MTRWPIPLMVALGLALGACPAPNGETDDTDPADRFDAFANADLTDPAVTQSFAENTSAPNMYTFAVLFGAALENGDGVCPARSETDGVVTYTGGCTDADGDAWSGSATVTRTGEESGIIGYENFGRTAEEDCNADGTVTSTQLFDGLVTIEADGRFEIAMEGEGTNVDKDACTATNATFAMEYAGRQLALTDGITEWSGTGRFGTSDRGKVTATTAAEVIDDNGCSYEAESGTTTMESADHTAVITYDGAVDCDDTSTVTWTLDGVDQGEITGIQCGTGLAAGALATVFAGLLVVGRRRRRG